MGLPGRALVVAFRARVGSRARLEEVIGARFAALRTRLVLKLAAVAVNAAADAGSALVLPDGA